MYTYPLYRPPSEARSLIIQVTEGCSYNKCKFCYMYKSKPFRVKSMEDIIEHIEELKLHHPSPRKIFLADGNVLCLETEKLLKLLGIIKKLFPKVSRISSYAGPRDLLNKSPEDLKLINEAGLDMLYLGVESGSDKVLKFMKKGVDADEMATAGIKAKQAGYVLSCMIMSGLGGRKLIEEHAYDSAVIISKIKPDFVGLLRLTLEDGMELLKDIEEGTFEMLTPKEVLIQNRIFVENIDSEGSVFRANHISNILDLGGTFNKDKERMLAEIDSVLNSNMEIEDFNYGI